MVSACLKVFAGTVESANVQARKNYTHDVISLFLNKWGNRNFLKNSHIFSVIFKCTWEWVASKMFQETKRQNDSYWLYIIVKLLHNFVLKMTNILNKYKMYYQIDILKHNQYSWFLLSHHHRVSQWKKKLNTQSNKIQPN